MALPKPNMDYVLASELSGGFLKPEMVSKDPTMASVAIIKSYDVKLEVKFKVRAKYEKVAIEDVPDGDTEWKRLFYLELEGNEVLWQPNPTQLKELSSSLGDYVKSWVGCTVKLWQQSTGSKATIGIRAIRNTQQAVANVNQMVVSNTQQQTAMANSEIDKNIIAIVELIKPLATFPIAWQGRQINDLSVSLAKVLPDAKERYYAVLYEIWQNLSKPTVNEGMIDF